MLQSLLMQGRFMRQSWAAQNALIFLFPLKGHHFVLKSVSFCFLVVQKKWHKMAQVARKIPSLD